ncbi:SCO family protein [Sphingobacteriaceae bacterium]|nr:SCO family protein [Sphingobacteriaceae bacterium]
MNYRFYFLALACLLQSCNTRELPVLGNPNGDKEDPAPTIPPFAFINQENKSVTDKTFEDKIYIADFIFLSCGTICPKMNNEMLKAYKVFEKDDRVLFISHTIDPQQDSVARLKRFAGELGVSSQKWHFVTGNKDSIYNLAQKNYFTSAYPDSSDKSNFIHGGGLLLVDKNKHIRGVYDGTNELETERLIKDIKLLLKEQF